MAKTSEVAGERDAVGDVVVRLDEPGELFVVDPRRLLTGSERLVTGMQEIVDRFLVQERIGRRQRIVLDLATTDASPEVAESLERAVRRYCRLRIENSTRQGDLIWRQGRKALWRGLSLFVLGIALSYWFSGPDVGDFERSLLGDGVFLVVAWIGLWYPLDLLLMGRQPLHREIRALRQIENLPVLVRAHSVASPAKDTSGVGDRPGETRTATSTEGAGRSGPERGSPP